jgi:D-sedoheptulose 7-phosphate isomerase
MKQYVQNHIEEVVEALRAVPHDEIARAINIIQRAYERDGRIYIFGNGGSLAIATHWVSDFNKTVFSHNLKQHIKRFQAIRLPTTEEEYSAWANDIGHDMVFLGPLQNYLQDTDCVIAISSSGNSKNIVKAIEYTKGRHIPVIGISGFDGGKLNQLADAKVLVSTNKGRYDIVESVHGAILHLITKYFIDAFDHELETRKK